MKVWIIQLEFLNGTKEILEVHSSYKSAMKKCNNINLKDYETISKVFVTEFGIMSEHDLMSVSEFYDFIINEGERLKENEV